jgi:hypothetical protein
MDAAEARLWIKRPKKLQKLQAIFGRFGRMRVSEITGSECRSYEKERESPTMARRELEDLRGAVNLHHRRGLLSVPVLVARCNLGFARRSQRPVDARHAGPQLLSIPSRETPSAARRRMSAALALAVGLRALVTPFAFGPGDTFPLALSSYPGFMARIRSEAFLPSILATILQRSATKRARRLCLVTMTVSPSWR